MPTLLVRLFSGFELSPGSVLHPGQPARCTLAGLDREHQTGNPGQKANWDPDLVTWPGFDSIDQYIITSYIILCRYKYIIYMFHREREKERERERVDF